MFLTETFYLMFHECQDVFMERFGEKLRSLRKQDGMTLKELALATGLTTHSHVSNIEHGRKKPSLEFVIEVSELFGVTIDQLVKDDLELD